MFLRETVIKKGNRTYRYWRLVKTYWDKKHKKVRHKTIAQLGKLNPREVSVLKSTLSGKAGESFSWENLTVKRSVDYLTTAILDRIYRYWELDKVIDSKAAEVLVINRCLSPESDYGVSRWYRQTILPDMLGIELNPTKIYRTLDKIYQGTEEIQKHLYQKIKELKLDDYELVFYDITSSYFQQSLSSLAQYGFSRDRRRDKKQIILAMAVTKKGFPFYWKVFEGNTRDITTVRGFADEIKNRFKLSQTCLVMDRGMVSKKNIEKLNNEKLKYVVTVKKDIVENIKDMPWEFLKTITEKNIDSKKDYFIYHSKRAYYKELRSTRGQRYILCFNPEKFIQEKKDRQEKIESIKKYFENKNKEFSRSKRKKSRELVREQLNSYLKSRGAQKIFRFRLYSRGKSFKISFKVNDNAVKEAAKLDGIFVLMSNVAVKDASAEDLINAYRDRMEIERTFHELKSFVEIRPVYHHNEHRIKAHVSVCVLSYLLNNTVKHLVRQKKDFEELTAQSVYNYLNSCKLIELNAGSRKRLKVTTPTAEQIRLTRILADENLFDENKIQKLQK